MIFICLFAITDAIHNEQISVYSKPVPLRHRVHSMWLRVHSTSFTNVSFAEEMLEVV